MKLYLYLLLFASAVLFAGYCVFTELWELVGFSVLFVGVMIYRLYRVYESNSQKIAFMFDAINNDDFSFQYPSVLGPKDELVNKALNRMVKILYQAKADATQREKYYELILSSVNTGVLVLEDSGYVFQTNAEALRLLGLPVFTHVKQLKRVDETLVRVITDIRAGSKEQVSFTNERGTVNLSIRTSEMILREKHVRILALNDIKSELDEKELDSWVRLIRVLTHEIMNSVTPIASMSETMLSLPLRNAREIQNGLEVIHITCRGLLSFVDSYRRFTSIPVPKPSLFYVEKFFERMVQLARHQNDFPGVEIVMAVEPSELILYADENLISQVVLNLLRNAMQAIGPCRTDGRIELRAYCDAAESVMIEVSNNGSPIMADVAQHIFIPFFTTKEGGNGIGLSVSRQIMRLSGGSLSLKSHPDAPVTVFLLMFP